MKFGYGIDLKKKLKMYLAQPRLLGELCVCFHLQLELWVENPELKISLRSHAI